MKEKDIQASEDLLIGLIQDDWPKKAAARAARILKSGDFVEIIDFHLKICQLTEEIINLFLYGEGLDVQIQIPSFWNRLAETMLDYAAFQKFCGPLKKETDFSWSCSYTRFQPPELWIRRRYWKTCGRIGNS